MVVSISASAEWVGIAKTNQGDTFYADPLTRMQTNYSVKIWILADYKVPDIVSDKKYYSTKSQIEFKCKSSELRYLYILGFPEQLGQGKARELLSDPDKWTPIVPGSAFSDLLLFACKT